MQHGLELRSRIDADGRLELSLQRVPVPQPAADEVVVRVEATPVNPSDLSLLLGPADLATAQRSERDGLPVVTAMLPQAAREGIAARFGQSLPVGNEGAGTVIAAGADMQAWMGRQVSAFGGALWTQYRCIKATQCQPLPEGATPRDGASWYVNPMTALCMVECLAQEGHTAMVHTAAASNLGQMLNRICLRDGIPLVNVVRSPGQAALLRGQGAAFVVDSSAADFQAQLTAAMAATGATLAFDAVGGGDLAGRILLAMEEAARQAAGGFSQYGSDRHKQVYVYGRLNTGPTSFDRTAIGHAWSIGGFLLRPCLRRFGPVVEARLRQRVMDELTTTFASHYTAEVPLAGLLQPALLRACSARATGQKLLLRPQAG